MLLRVGTNLRLLLEHQKETKAALVGNGWCYLTTNKSTPLPHDATLKDMNPHDHDQHDATVDLCCDDTTMESDD
jgi:hypothetical protein